MTGQAPENRLAELEEYFLKSAKPQSFVGEQSAEIKHDKDFNNLCILIEKETGSPVTSETTVLEFYAKFDAVKKAAKEKTKTWRKKTR